MIDRLEIHHLRTLDALYRSPSITVAAEHLDLSQQAVSQQLRRLRTITGDRLFISSGHGVVPTPYARRIEPHVRQVLALLQAIPPPDAFAPERVERSVTISATDHAQQVLVVGLLDDLRTHAPGVTLVVVDIESAGLMRCMERGEIDLAFTSRDYVSAGLVCESLFHERYRCVSSIPALVTGETIPLERLVEYPFVVVSPGVPDLAGSANAWFQRRGLRRQVRVSAPSFFMAIRYLRRTAMVGFLPSRLLPCEGLAEVMLDAYPPGYEMVVAWHTSATGDPFLAWMLERVRARLAEPVLT